MRAIIKMSESVVFRQRRESYNITASDVALGFAVCVVSVDQ